MRRGTRGATYRDDVGGLVPAIHDTLSGVIPSGPTISCGPRSSPFSRWWRACPTTPPWAKCIGPCSRSGTDRNPQNCWVFRCLHPSMGENRTVSGPAGVDALKWTSENHEPTEVTSVRPVADRIGGERPDDDLGLSRRSTDCPLQPAIDSIPLGAKRSWCRRAPTSRAASPSAESRW